MCVYTNKHIYSAPIPNFGIISVSLESYSLEFELRDSIGGGADFHMKGGWSAVLLEGVELEGAELSSVFLKF